MVLVVGTVAKYLALSTWIDAVTRSCHLATWHQTKMQIKPKCRSKQRLCNIYGKLTSGMSTSLNYTSHYQHTETYNLVYYSVKCMCPTFTINTVTVYL